MGSRFTAKPILLILNRQDTENTKEGKYRLSIYLAIFASLAVYSFC